MATICEFRARDDFRRHGIMPVNYFLFNWCVALFGRVKYYLLDQYHPWCVTLMTLLVYWGDKCTPALNALPLSLV